MLEQGDGRPSKKEMDHWNKKIGMSEEPGEDIGAQALRELHESQGEAIDGDTTIVKAIQQYFSTRKGNVHGEHRYAAAEIAELAGGINPDDIPVDLVESVREEMIQLDQVMSRIATDLIRTNDRLRARPKVLANSTLREMRNQGLMDQFNNIDEKIIEDVANRIALIMFR